MARIDCILNLLAFQVHTSLLLTFVLCCSGAPYLSPSPSELSAGDAVRVELDPDLFKIAQEDHGGWNDLMAEVRVFSRNQVTQGNSKFNLCNMTVSDVYID